MENEKAACGGNTRVSSEHQRSLLHSHTLLFLFSERHKAEVSCSVSGKGGTLFWSPVCGCHNKMSNCSEQHETSPERKAPQLPERVLLQVLITSPTFAPADPKIKGPHGCYSTTGVGMLPYLRNNTGNLHKMPQDGVYPHLQLGFHLKVGSRG